MYQFSKEDAISFARQQGIATRTKGEELVFNICPQCHGGRKRDKGTFSINMRTGQCECKRSSCGYRGNMITLSRDFDYSLSEEIDRYYNRNDFNNRFKKFTMKEIIVKDAAIEYCKSRGISEEVCRKYELTTKKDNDNVLVFPFKNQDGELKFIKYRNMAFKKGETSGSKEWCEKECMPILFGMNHCEGNEQLVITEGQLDSLSCASAGIKNAVSVPTGCNGFTWLPHCWDWFISFKELVVFGDYEHGEVTLADTLRKRFPNAVRIVKPESYKDCKDANELLQKYGPQALIDAVNEAEAPPITQLKDLSDVEAIDIYKTEAISSGIRVLDTILSGGFHVGQLVILTGKCGDGKSTFMSQLIVNAVEDGYSTFAYSGELVDFYFKRWIDFQVAGKKDITRTELDAISKWYRGKIFLYDNNVIAKGDEELKTVLQVAEEAICKKNCKFLCIDNLMTAIDVNPKEDVYQAQKHFVNELANMAKLHNVVIVLVAHPKKSQFGFNNDDVSGASEITKLADIIMNYTRIRTEKGEEERDDLRELQITKNRLTGKLTNKKNQIILAYDDDSKRIDAENVGFNRVYGWCKDKKDGFVDLDKMQVDLPF